MTAALSHATFARQVRSMFHIEDLDATPLAVELIDANQLYKAVHQDSFSIVFRGPTAPLLPQGTYRFHHKEMGEFDLFIVPIRRDTGGLYYEACFSRLYVEQAL